MELDKIKLDGVVANVSNIEIARQILEQLTGLKPFLRFELQLSGGRVPVVLFDCGDHAIELIGGAHSRRAAGLGHISKVTLELPGCEPAEALLDQDTLLCVRPGPAARIAEISIRSAAPRADAAVLAGACGAEVLPSDETAVGLGGTTLRLLPSGKAVAPRPEPNMGTLGWHRIGLGCAALEPAVEALAATSAELLLAPFEVMSGLREAVFQLPSGLLVQPVEQKLYKMLPVIAVKWLAAKLTGRPLRFAHAPLCAG